MRLEQMGSSLTFNLDSFGTVSQVTTVVTATNSSNSKINSSSSDEVYTSISGMKVCLNF